MNHITSPDLPCQSLNYKKSNNLLRAYDAAQARASVDLRKQETGRSKPLQGSLSCPFYHSIVCENIFTCPLMRQFDCPRIGQADSTAVGFNLYSILARNKGGK